MMCRKGVEEPLIARDVVGMEAAIRAVKRGAEKKAAKPEQSTKRMAN
jgi:hypothetical protein